MDDFTKKLNSEIASYLDMEKKFEDQISEKQIDNNKLSDSNEYLQTQQKHQENIINSYKLDIQIQKSKTQNLSVEVQMLNETTVQLAKD